MYDFNFSAKVTSLRPFILLCCSTYFQSSLKSQPIFLLQLVWIVTIHLLQQNETLQSKFPVENLDNFGVFFFYIILMPFYFLSFSI